MTLCGRLDLCFYLPACDILSVLVVFEYGRVEWKEAASKFQSESSDQ